MSTTTFTTREHREKIGKSFARQRRALALRSQLGIGKAQTKCRVVEGLHCEISEGDFSMSVDMSPKAGGTNCGPNPGVLGRGALASCLAISYMQWAAFRGVHIDHLEVLVSADYNVGADYGIRPDVQPGYQHVQYCVMVKSDEHPRRIKEIIEEADACGPYLSVWKNATAIERCVHIESSRELL